MSDDLISRDETLKVLRGKAIAKYPNSFFYGLFAAANEILDISAVDAVEVVRCKDCEYYEAEECVNPYIFMSDGAHLYTGINDFCSYGERKEE